MGVDLGAKLEAPPKESSCENFFTTKRKKMKELNEKSILEVSQIILDEQNEKQDKYEYLIL